MKKIGLFTALFIFLACSGASNAWAVACPIGGPIYHGSGQAGAAIAECSDRIKKAQAAGKKLPNPEAWRASNPCAGISNCSLYPLSWSASSARSGVTETKSAQARSTKPKVEPNPTAKERRRETASSPSGNRQETVAQSSAASAVAATPKPAPPVLEGPTPALATVASRVEAPDAPRLTNAPAAADTKPSLVLPVEFPVVAPKATALEKRVALVIGNAAYKDHSSLDNPKNDANAMAETLRELGFASVTVVYDAGRDQLSRALQSFALEAETADWALVYYAGHGIEVSGSNYLVPVDAKLRTDRDVTFEAIALEQVLNAVEPAQKLRLIILDACRDNPFLSRMRRTLVSRSVGRGLAPIETDRSMLVVFAAKHGQVSLDRVDGENSPFTTSLVRWMKAPGIELNKVLRHVRDDVMKLTKQQQEPYQYGSLSSEDYYFRASSSVAGKNQ